MKASKTTGSTEEIHPWMWYAPEGCTVLIAGTFPTAPKNRSFDFFYPNLRNLFWKVMEQLSGIKIHANTGEAAVAQRKQILGKLNIALTDMGHTIARNDGSSLDAMLTPVVYMDIFKILDENTTIEKIILTSSSGRASAYQWFVNYLNEQKHSFEFWVDKLPFYGRLNYKGRAIIVVVVPSSSPAAAIGLERLLAIYKQEFPIDL